MHLPFTRNPQPATRNSSSRRHVLAEKSKGIRVNELAKELGVERKAILAKLKSEGLGDAAPNHMSRISFGLAESVREWFVHAGDGGVGTAVETAAPVQLETAVKVAKSRSRGKKRADGSSDDEHDANGGGTMTATEVMDAPAPAAPVGRPRAPGAS